jgi:hypothetical protein
MKRDQYMGMDVHQATTVVVVLDANGKVILETMVATEAAAIIRLVQGLSGPLHVTFEETTQAGWLYEVIRAFVAEVMVFLNTGPANAVLVNVALPEIRATAIASAIFVYHLLGDVPSPILIGYASDRLGSLQAALMLTSAAMAVSGGFYLYGARTLGEDTDRVARTVAERERSLLGATANAAGTPDAP